MVIRLPPPEQLDTSDEPKSKLDTVLGIIEGLIDSLIESELYKSLLLIVFVLTMLAFLSLTTLIAQGYFRQHHPDIYSLGMGGQVLVALTPMAILLFPVLVSVILVFTSRRMPPSR